MTARVLLLHEFRGPSGGAERYLERLAAGLSGLGHDVSALVFAESRTEGQHHVEQLGLSAMADLVIGRARPGPIRRAVRQHQPDLLHWNFSDPFSFRGATFLALPWRRPSVITDHLPMLRVGAHYELTRRVLNRHIARVIVVGESSRRAALDHWSRWSPRLVTVPNGVELPATWRPRPDAAKRELALLFVGRLSEQKQPERTVETLAELTTRGVAARLTIIGDGDLATALSSLAHDLGVSGRVDFLGRRDDVADLMTAHDVLLAPARWEGLPLVPIEALASGLPLVVSDIDAHREVIGDSRAAVIVTGDRPSDWAAAVMQVSEDLPGASAAARRRGEAFSVTEMARATSAVYREVTE